MNRTKIASLAAGLCLAGVAVVAEPFTLQDCVDYALTNSPELAQLEIDVHSSKLATLIERAEFDFGLSANVEQRTEDGADNRSASITKRLWGDLDLSLSASHSESTEENSDSYSLALSKTILGGGTIRASRLGVDNSVLDEAIYLNTAAQKRRELTYGTKRAYYRIIRAIQTLKVRELRLQRARKNLEHALAREEPLDIATARIEVPENEALVLQAKRSIESAYDALKELLGMVAAHEMGIEPSFEYRERAIDVEADIQHALENDESLINAALTRRKHVNTARAIHPEIWPEVTLSASAAQTETTGPAIVDEPRGDEIDYRVLVSLDWALGSRAERAASKKAQNDINRQAIAIRAARLAKVTRIRELGRRITEAADSVKLQIERVSLTERLSELYADRWENGEIDILEYIRSQNDLENSRVRLIDLQSSYMELLGEYEFATGR